MRVERIVSSPLRGEGDREAVEGREGRALSPCPSTTLRVVPLPIDDGEETGS